MRCLVVGGGRIALSHLPHLIAHSQIEVVGIVEPNRGLRFVLNKLFRVRTFKALEQVAVDKYDIAFVLTPPASHYALAKALLEVRKHVFIEKPMTLAPDQSLELCTLARDLGLSLTCGYVYRFHPVFAEFKRILESRKYGRPLKASLSMRGNVVGGKSKVTWRNVGVGSGCLYDYGCHVVDLSLFLFGPACSVRCLEKKELFHPEVIDSFTSVLGHGSSGSTEVRITCDWADDTLRKAQLDLWVQTDHAELTTDGQQIVVNVGDKSLSQSIADLDTSVDYYLRGEEFQRQLDFFVGSLEAPEISYEHAMQSLAVDKILLDIYEQAV